MPSKDVPSGTTYWVNGADVLVTKIKGRTLKVGSPASSCYTGIRMSPGSYTGGGRTPGGGYTVQTVMAKVTGNQLTIRQDGGWSTYIKSSRSTVKRLGGARPAEWFSDCKLRF